jgi:hypothetical protein
MSRRRCRDADTPRPALYGNDTHRGARHVRLAAAVLAFAAVCAPHAVTAADLGCPIDSSLVLVALAGGAQHVDLPQFDRPNEDFGTKPRFAFDLGVLARRWFEPHVEVAFTYLGGSDSLDAVLAARGSTDKSLGTLVQAQAGARLRWARCGRWQPYAHAAGGVARFRLAAPDEPGFTETDPIWSAGGGVELWLHRRLLVRAEGLYIGQAAPDGTRTHAVAQLALAYAFPRSILSP